MARNGDVAEARQEGSRWINERPSGDEVAHWFAENVKLHDDLEHKDYVSGLVLIPAIEKTKTTIVRKDATGKDKRAVIDDESFQVFIPYAKVETRVKYFWDYVAAHEDWLGVIEPGRVARPAGEEPPVALPDGFFRMPRVGVDGKTTWHLGCSMRVRIYERAKVEYVETYVGTHRARVLEGVPIMSPPAGTKLVPENTKWGPDENVLMKAETGAVGRALGLAGMLVIPGSGVATAEDMQDLQRPEPAAGAQLPAEAAPTEEPPADIRGAMTAAIARLQPEGRGLLQAWADEKKINLDEPANDTQARNIERRATKIATDAEAKAEPAS